MLVYVVIKDRNPYVCATKDVYSSGALPVDTDTVLTVSFFPRAIMNLHNFLFVDKNQYCSG
jgi:hypothetical protein